MADQGSEGRLSPYLRKQRFKAAKPFLKGRILDVGCGSGALAGLIDPASYVGIEIDDASLSIAKESFPHHSFKKHLSSVDEKFDTIVSLAVIEHVSDPAEFLNTLSKYIYDDLNGRIVVTTPHPSMEWIHYLGASVGLFSKHANNEHEELLDQKKLTMVGEFAGLVMVKYKRFLLGGNQLAVFVQDR